MQQLKLIARASQPWLVLFGLSLLWRALLISWFPEVYPWDALTRLVERDRLLVRHWLPLPQLPLFLSYHLNLGLQTVRYFYAVVGSCGAVAAGLLVAKFLNSERIGLATGLLLSVLPAFVLTTIVPYQEGFMVLTGVMVLWGVYELRPQSGVSTSRAVTSVPFWLATGGLILGVMVRYELWVLAAGVFVLAGLERWRATGAPWTAIPALVLCTAWTATANLRNPGVGLSPNRAVVRSELADLSLLGVMGRFAEYMLAVATTVLHTFTVLGTALIFVGLFQLYRRSKQSTVIFLSCLVAATALTALRALNSATLTTRMQFLPLVLCLPMIALGLWQFPVSRLLNTGVGRAVRSAALLLVATGLLLVGARAIGKASTAVEPERHAATLLAEVPSDAVVKIVPRSNENPWNESLIAAIFGNNLSLDPLNPRFVYEGRSSLATPRPPDFVLAWCITQYRLLSPSSFSTECSESSIDEVGK